MFLTGNCFQDFENAGVNVMFIILFTVTNKCVGDITSVTTFGSTIVTVHTYEQAVQLLNKKSGIYSCRSKIEMLHLGGLEHHVALLPYGPQLKECRRMLRADINQGSIQQYYPLQEATTLRFLRSLAKSPTKFYELIEW